MFDARRRDGFDERVAHAVALLRSAAHEHAGAIVQATSLGAEDMVVTDLIARHGLPIVLATLDTRLLHAQTLALIPAIAQRYGFEVVRFAPRVGFSGADFVTYRANDGTNTSAPARVLIRVRSLNKKPNAGDDFGTTNEDTA